jgi:hypothetical protein
MADKTPNKKRKKLSDLGTIFICFLDLLWGIFLVSQFEKKGYIDLPRELITLYGRDAQITAYCVAGCASLIFIYSIIVVGKSWCNKKVEKET